MSSNNDAPLHAKCVATAASTIELQDHSVSRKQTGRPFFSHLQFSGDGTTILAQSADHRLRTFILPADLLDETEQPHRISDYTSYQSATPIQICSLYPNFNLQDLSTTVYLCASNDLPISMRNAVRFETIHAQYPWKNPKTEAFIVPKSLCWTRDRENFIAGGFDKIGVFNAHRNGEGPVVEQKAGELIKHRPRGFVMALDVSSDGMLAAGTNERQIALFGAEGRGECVTSFSVRDGSAGRGDPTKGSGITQLAWSPSGTYLVAAERQSDGVHVYDMRNTLRRVAFLHGRKARTTQRLDFDLTPTMCGTELWAGGTDGAVRMWKDPGSVEDFHAPDVALTLCGDPVGGVAWHPQGSVLATCAGTFERQAVGHSAADSDSDSEDNNDGDFEVESCLKVWDMIEDKGSITDEQPQ